MNLPYPPVPKGFTYCKHGALDHPLGYNSMDVALYKDSYADYPEMDWDVTGWSGSVENGHYALRVGSDVWKKNMPYPEHTPPTAPEGMKWEYRGVGWRRTEAATYYFIKNEGSASIPVYQSPQGMKHHYFEAVPIFKGSGFTEGNRLGKTHTAIDLLPFAGVIDERTPVTFDTHIGENPKESAGRKKCPMHLLPPEFLIQTANVLGYGAYDAPRTDGKNGYGPWNWRDQPIKLSTYQAAILRHWSKILDGEMVDGSHGQSHFASIAANCAIILDAEKHGTLVDDRPINP